MVKLARTALAATLAAGLGIAAAQAEDITAETLVAEVNGTAITLGHVISMRSLLPPQFRELPDDVLFPALIEQLVEQTLLADTMEGRLSRAEQLHLENEARNFIANSALTSAALDAVTDVALSDAYAEFVSEFEAEGPAPEFNAAHILVQTEAIAQEVRARIDAGEDFGDLARLHSRDGAAQNGGELGWFGLGVMIEPFENAVIALQPGEVSQPVETRFGWHVVRLNDVRDAIAPPIEEMRDALSEQIQRNAARALIDSLVAGAAITRFDEALDPALLSRTELLDD